MSQPETRWYYVVLRHRETGETVRSEVEAVNSEEAVQLALEGCDWTEREIEVMEWNEMSEIVTGDIWPDQQEEWRKKHERR